MEARSNQLAIVILNWNGKSLLQKFLPTLIAHKQAANIYVIDNASKDDSCKWLKDNYQEIEVIVLDKNLGYAGGYQAGLKRIDAAYYCLLNNDVEVTPNWLTPILNEFENPNIAAVQPKILDYKNPNYFEYAGAGGGMLDALGYPYCRGRVFDFIEKDTGQYDDAQDIFWASGACLFIRSSDFWSVGGLDKDYFAHQEEIDLCWRILNQNKKIRYCGASTVYHLGGASLHYENPQKTYLNFRNSLFSIVKNYKGIQTIFVVFIRMILDGIAASQFLFKKKPKHFVAILKAHFSFYKNIPKLLRKRKNITKTKIHYNTKSIVMDYFVYKKYKN